MLLATFLTLPHGLQAQRCATVEYQKLRAIHHPQLENKAQFENWLNNKIQSRKAKHLLKEEAVVYTIPVVVHVIHSGEVLNVGRNISDQQILSQIEVLNEDFRRMNSDAANTPAMFSSVAADVEIEFALAQRDPEGLSTSGVVRIDGQQSEWSLTENYELKRLSYWPAEDYLNIWVADISGNYLGYAQFPSSTMDGLENASNSRATDGVVIDYRAFGSKDKYPEANLINAYNLGRTTTHEVGHYFGLRHIWGDDSGGCSASDYVDDTPNQGGSSSGCPDTNPTTCESTDMIQNYMDYTDDVCMNLYTEGQKTRIRAILDNSPRRASLKDSKGNLPPIIVSNNLGIRNIISPQRFECGTSLAPELEIRNYGDNDITSVQIALSIDDLTQETVTFSLDLAPLEVSEVVFAPVILNAGSYVLGFEVIEVNETTDGNADNNIKSKSITVSDPVTLPIKENFEGLPAGQEPENWRILNPDGLYTWQATNANNGENGNSALSINFYNYEIEGEYDTLLSPVFDLSPDHSAVLSFDRAYANYSGVFDEGLIIKLSTNCGRTFDHTIFESYGKDLATVSQTSSSYAPSGSGDWKNERLFIEEFPGLSDLRIAFIAKNGYGNNIYIDNISIDEVEDASEFRDLELIGLNQPALVSCAIELEPTIAVRNSGYIIENELHITYEFDNQVVTDTYNTKDIEPGETVHIPLGKMLFDIGAHTYNIYLTNTDDVNPNNDTISGYFYVNDTKDHIPIKETFEDLKSSDWLIVDNDKNITWKPIKTNKGTSLYLDAENYNTIGQEEWLVSPALDFTTANEANLSFDLAYSYANDSKDGLTLLVSTNCGATYEDVVFSKFGEELSTGSFSGAPDSDESWSRIAINMTEYLHEEEVRIAFIYTNSNGNNIYLDNVQVFVTDSPVVNVENNITHPYPNPSEDGIFKLTFDLPSKELVQIGIYNMKGQLIFNDTYENTLNQTYTFDYSHQPQGVYLIKIAGETFTQTKRIFVRP